MHLIAGTVEPSALMASLSKVRPIFHSEADFQFAFSQAVRETAPDMRVRLEVRQSDEKAEYLDLVCWTPTARTLIEFKYATVGWRGCDPAGERYRVADHAAFDLTRRYFIHDVRRLERFTSAESEDTATNGLAILLTNAATLWDAPRRKDTRDANFRLTDGRTLRGHLVWGTGETPQYDQHLDGTYRVDWQDYSNLRAARGRFRWLCVPVEAGSRPPAVGQVP